MHYYRRRSVFISLSLAALLVLYVPYVGWPFAWMETYFHELSHGIVGIATGGRVLSLKLDWSGSGLCSVAGGRIAWVAFAGYAGACIWGTLIYLIAASASHRASQAIAAGLAILIVLTMILWVRDATSLLICLVLLSLFWIAMRFSEHFSVSLILQFIGLSVLLGASKAPWYLLDEANDGDSATLAMVTQIPEIYWVMIWALIAFACIAYLWRKTFSY